MLIFKNKITMFYRIPIQWNVKSKSRFLAYAGNDNSHSFFINFVLSLFFIFIFNNYYVFGQSISQMELSYQNFTQEFIKEQAKLDSLKAIHNKMIATIDKEKQNKTGNENKIIGMLASAVVISNQIKEQQFILDRIEMALENSKTILDKSYAAIIDSLKNIENSNINSKDQEYIKSLKLKYIEKRVVVAPKIYSLSFNPENLIQYKQSSGIDSVLKNIYLEYLSNALEEVNQQSKQLVLIKDEIEEVVNLQNETFDFIEDVDSEIMFNPALQTSLTLENNDGVFSGGSLDRIDDEFSNFYIQANSYLHIFNQLKTSTNIDLQSPWQTPTDTIPANLTIQQYLDLLETVGKMLQDYKTILEHKLESN